MIPRMSRCTILVVAVFLSQLCLAQTPSSQNSEHAKFTLSIQKAAVAALNFRQGDATSFNRARADFTADGWKDFLTHMQGFLDAKGAPTFTSSFVVKHDARLLDEKNGLTHLRIPGSLTQSNKLGRTIYDPAAIEVYADKEAKIQRLQQITCLGASKACE
ncbi:MAG TPA: hypothetical protein VG204_04435 [Terriglobia bacterium]|nr:hypothetical protein [Terriglobia bacterium]